MSTVVSRGGTSRPPRRRAPRKAAAEEPAEKPGFFSPAAQPIERKHWWQRPELDDRTRGLIILGRANWSQARRLILLLLISMFMMGLGSTLVSTYDLA